MNRSYESFLFNFSDSYTGGGLKRLMAYSSWFNEHGGASFIVNYRLNGIDKHFPVNKYLFLRQSRFPRAINYSSQLNNLIADAGAIDIYYFYGIPLPRKVGRVNWFHLNNILPLTKAIQQGRPIEGIATVIHLPIIILHILRRLWRGSGNYGNVRYSSEKLLSTGFRYRLGVEGAVRRIAETQRLMIS